MERNITLTFRNTLIILILVFGLATIMGTGGGGGGASGGDDQTTVEDDAGSDNNDSDDSVVDDVTGGGDDGSDDGGSDSDDSSDGGDSGVFILTSDDYNNGAAMPLVHACSYYGGSDVSPQLSWTSAPENTDSFAIVMDDEDTPCGTGDDACPHWMVYNIPSHVTNLTQGETVTDISGVTEGLGTGYVGPCPPNPPHTYKITLYALKSTMPTIPAGTVLTRSQFASNYSSHIIGSTTLEGTFAP